MEMAIDGAATLMMVVIDEYSLTNTELELCLIFPAILEATATIVLHLQPVELTFKSTNHLSTRQLIQFASLQ